ncbi:unnamed protein product, partial [Cyprideis torosa]
MLANTLSRRGLGWAGIPGSVRFFRVKPSPATIVQVAPKVIEVELPTVNKSLAEKFKDRDQAMKESQHLEYVDIGFAVEKDPLWKVPTLEVNGRIRKDSSEGKFSIDISSVKDQWWSSGSASKEIAKLAEHYGIFQDLFRGAATFHPVVRMDISYPVEDLGRGEEMRVSPVHMGNLLKPQEVGHASLFPFLPLFTFISS